MALKVLSALDGAKTQLYHFSAILIAGMGFFTDAYDLFCIPPVSNLLPLQQDMVWRIILMLGAVPAGLTYYWRMKMRETARYTALVAENANQAAADMSKVLHLDIEEDEKGVLKIGTPEHKFGLFSRDFVKHHGPQLLGTTSTWFFVDVAFYSSNLFQNDIYRDISFLRKPCYHKLSDDVCHPKPLDKLCHPKPLDEVLYNASAQAVIALWATLPGYVFTIILIDRIGRRKIQFVGFLFMSAFLFVLAIRYDKWVDDWNHGFLAIYSLTFFFANFGPNTTTFVVPAELFPARLRSTCHGISAAAGKAGAIIGVVIISVLANQNKHEDPFYCKEGRDPKDKGQNRPKDKGQEIFLYSLAVASCLGFFCTFFIPETMGRSLEENEVEPGLSAAEVELQVHPGSGSTEHSRG